MDADGLGDLKEADQLESIQSLGSRLSEGRRGPRQGRQCGGLRSQGPLDWGSDANGCAARSLGTPTSAGFNFNLNSPASLLPLLGAVTAVAAGIGVAL